MRRNPPPPPLGNKRGIGNRGGGRPPSDVVALAKVHTEMAIRRLSEIASTNERAVVAASEVLLNRGWGQSKQTVEILTPELTQRIKALVGALRGKV